MMKKNFILPLLAAASLTGVAQGEEQSLAINGDVSDGNWSIVLDLNTEKLEEIFKSSPTNYTGVNLVSWSGTADYSWDPLIGDRKYATGKDHTASYWLGWGSTYFKEWPLWQETGMHAGLQMGFGADSIADIDHTPNLNSELEWAGLVPYYTNAGYYRAHTRYDADGNFSQTNATGDKDTAQTMQNLADALSIDNATISSATLAIVHNNQNKTYDENGNLVDIGNGYDAHTDEIAHSQTLQYLIVTYEKTNGEKFTITYIAEVDDDGTTNPDSESILLDTFGSTYPSSNRYDVDELASVKINTDYVNSGTVYDYVLSPGEVAIAAGIPIPEPASATLSLMALTALCARRRRRK